MPTATAEPGPTCPLIEPAAEPPEPACIPAVLPADAAHRSKDDAGGQRDDNLAHVTEDGAAGPIRITGHRTSRRPVGLHQVCLHLAERGANRLANVEPRLWDEKCDAIVTADHLVPETLGQRTRDAMAQGRDELNPV